MSDSESVTSTRKIKKPKRFSSPSTKRCGFKWKTPTKFYCETCKCYFSAKDKLEKHNLTLRHNKNLTAIGNIPEVYSCACGKTFTKDTLLKGHIDNCKNGLKHAPSYGWNLYEESKISESDDLEITKEDIEELKNILSDKKEELDKTELTNEDLENFFNKLPDDEFDKIFSCLTDGKKISKKSKRKKRKSKSKKRKNK